MTTIRKIPTSKIDGNDANNTSTNEIRPFGELAVYINEDVPTQKLELLMFDGVRTHLRSKVLAKGTFYGGDADSGDGYANDTIKLIPDAELHYDDGNYGNDQYLIIDPTNPNHIHIRAGGPQDDSDATLILGGEKSNITIDDQANAHVSIFSRTADNSTSHVWKFNNDGSTRFPIMDPDLHNDNSPPELGEVLQFNSIYQSVITNAVPALDVDAQRIIIQGQRGTGTGEGGDVYLWGGDSTVDGGDIKIYAGDADSSVGGVAPDLHDGGYVYIKGGTGFDTGGEVRLTGGYSAGGIGGDIKLSAGYGTSAAGEVIIESNSNTWTFDNDKKLNFPGFQNSQSFNKANGNLTIATASSGTAWTGSLYHSTVKLIIQAEYIVDSIYQVQSCEVLLVRSSGTVVSHVTYGNVYTDEPLFTVTSSVDEGSTDTVLEVNNFTAGNLYISTFATTLGSRN